jgi:hypothetical protein
MLGVLLAAFSGCNDDEQQKVNRSQAQVAEASRELVQADAKTRGEIVALQRDLQVGQADLGRQRDQLENDRRQYADQRNRDPILANTILNVGTILACLLPLVLCIVLALGLRDHSQTDSTLSEILVEEIAGEKPLLLPTMSRQAALGQAPSEEGLPELPRADAA